MNPNLTASDRDDPTAAPVDRSSRRAFLGSAAMLGPAASAGRFAVG